MRKAYYEQNKNEILEKNRVYYHENKNIILPRCKEYYIENRSKILLQRKEYAKNNHLKIKHRKNKLGKERRRIVLEYYGGLNPECKCCGNTFYNHLTIDHITGNGSDHRKEIGTGGDRIIKYLINNNFPDGYQVLCMLCNKSKSNKISCFHKSLLQRIDSKRKYYINYKYRIFSHYCNNNIVFCKCCGENRIEFLELDHINGGGNKHKKELNIKGSGNAIYNWIIKNGFPKGFQVLCANCNYAKAHYSKCECQSIHPKLIDLILPDEKDIEL